MLLEPRPNEWETNGYSWHCTCGTGSAEGLYDYSLMYLGAQAHAQRWPTHRVYLDREQRRWVIPVSASGGGAR